MPPSLRSRLAEAATNFAHGAVRFVARRIVYPGALGDVWEHIDRGLLEEALALIAEIDWTPGPDKARALGLRGQALEELERFDEATEAFLAAVREAPRGPAAGKLAELAVARSDPRLAREALLALRDAYGASLESILGAEKDRTFTLAELEMLATPPVAPGGSGGP